MTAVASKRTSVRRPNNTQRLPGRVGLQEAARRHLSASSFDSMRRPRIARSRAVSVVAASRWNCS
jgi:hypothetical protein